MRNLSRVNPKGPKQIKGKAQRILTTHESIDGQSLLTKIDGTFEKMAQNGAGEETEEGEMLLLQTLFDVDEFLATKRKSDAPTMQKIASAIGDKILYGDWSSSNLGTKSAAIRIATVRILSHLCAVGEKWVLKMLQRNIDIILLRALHVREVCPVERHEALRLIVAMFSALSSRSVAVLVGWWRFRLFAKNALFFLFGAAALGGGIPSTEGQTAPKKDPQGVEDTKTPIEDRQAPRELFAVASCILLEFLARFPSLFVALGLRLDWLARLMRKCFETDSAAHLARIGAQLLANLLDLLDTRVHGETHLLVQQIFAPLLDFSILCAVPSLTGAGHQQLIAENISRHKLQLCAICLADLLKTWPGFFACFAGGNSPRHSPCQSIIAFLNSTSNLEEQQEKLVGVEVFCRMLGLPYANKELGTWDEAVQFYERTNGPDPYQSSLTERFVLAELPSLRRSLIKNDERADLFTICQSVHVYTLCHSGLPEALVQTAVQNPDNPCAIKATLLLADIVHFAAESLPKEWRLKANGIAGLINRAAKAFHPDLFGQGPIRGSCFDENLEHAELDWTNANNKTYSNAIKLYARIDQIERLRARPVEEKLRELHTFLLPNLGDDVGEAQRRRSSGEHSALASGSRRHSSRASSSGQTTGETKDEIEVCLALLDDLLTRAFVDPPNLDPAIGQPHSVGDGSQDKRQPTNNDGLPQWPVIWHILHTVGNNLSGRTVDKCIKLFDRLVHHFLPSNRHFLCRDVDPLSVACAQQCFRLLCLCAHSSVSVGLDNSQWAAQQVASFLLNFCAQFQILEQNESIFCSRFPLPSGVRHYFAPLRIISALPAGQKLLEQTALNQLLYDLALKPSTNNSLIKLIIVSLDYFPGAGTGAEGGHGIFARGLFEAVLLHSTLNETVKKWATCFLDIFITLEQLGHLPTFPCWHWTLHLAFCQLINPSLKIVRCAAKLLLNWLPKCPLEARKTTLILLRSAKLELLGNWGMLLEVFLYGDWDEGSLCENEQMARKALRAWKSQFNARYVDIVQERLRKTLFLDSVDTFQQKRSMEGHFARASFDDESGRGRPCLFSPVHLYGQLIRTKTGQFLLQSESAVNEIIGTLRGFSTGENVDQKQVKAALFALAHLLANADPFRAHLFSFVDHSTASPTASVDVRRVSFSISALVRLLCDCVHQQQSLCVRGFALWAANIAANGNGRVAELLALLGWQCGGENAIDLRPTKVPRNLFRKMSKWPNDMDNGDNEGEVLSVHRPRICTEFLPRRGKEERKAPMVAPVSSNSRRTLFRSTSLTAAPLSSDAMQHPTEPLSRHTFVRERSFDQIWCQMPSKVGKWAESFSSTTRTFGCVTSAAANDALSICQRKAQQQQKIIEDNDHDNRQPQFIITEKENDELIAYRRFLVTAGEINDYEMSSSRRQSANNFVGLCTKSTEPGEGRQWRRDGAVFLPTFSALFGKSVLENVERGKRIAASAAAADNDLKMSRFHNRWRCIFCAAANNHFGLQFRHTNCDGHDGTVGGFGVTWTGAKFEALSLIDQLANAEIGTANSNKQMAKLLKLFSDEPTVFGNQCLLSDVLQILSDSTTLSFDLRCTIYELFVHAF